MSSWEPVLTCVHETGVIQVVMFSSRRGWIAIGVLLGTLATWNLLPRHPEQPPKSPPVPLPRDRLFHPDVVIQSRALSKLPRDLLAIPLLGNLLTEELVNYYERNENRLTLEGTFRRLAYEHQMGVGDKIIAHVLNTPAQVALWKNQDGKLKDYLLLLPKKGLWHFVEALSKLARGDTQLSRQGDFQLPNGDSYTLWRIQHTPRHRLQVAVYRNQLAIHTDPTLFDPQGNAQRLEAIGQFFASAGPDSLGVGLRLPPLQETHRLAAQASYISFGYQHFFPALETLRLDFNPDRGWRTTLLTNAATPPPEDLWTRLPAAPALCLALPVDKPRLLHYLQQLRNDPALPELVNHLRPPAAICWYGNSRLHTPIAVLPVAQGREAWLPLLGTLFAHTIGTREGPLPVTREQARGDAPPSGPAETGKTTPALNHNPLPVEETPCAGGKVWRRQVSAASAPLDSKQSPHAKEMRFKRYFSVVLALCHDTLILTPDEFLADRTLGVLDKSYPALADTLDKGGRDVSLTVVPGSLAELLRKTLADSLPPTSEPVFHASVKKRFLPLLDQIATLPAYNLATPRQAHIWEPLAWHARPPVAP
ncbi:MAG: DUF2138 family protein [Magnetococcus sp. DMHC-1]